MKKYLLMIGVALIICLFFSVPFIGLPDAYAYGDDYDEDYYDYEYYDDGYYDDYNNHSEDITVRVIATIAVGIIVFIIVVVVLVAKNRNVKKATLAGGYVAGDGLSLEKNYDHYTHTTTTYIPKGTKKD